ncbi:hypothetical protein RQM47_07955 [Rubrivirga sp. S365]|uniref:hypothetical protein n=1 Tax=Rubrivirga sp. S365 TaxID=3076080 RepID=UPI0028C8E05B|nr:hypothetical protein [Rubrivirga sp. S365]MDT7856570.1 hypothetical protein [Rubrivirga sp. S365]
MPAPLLRPAPAGLLVFAVCALAGCTHIQPAPLASAGGRSDVNDRARTADATVVLADGERARARALHLAPDLATWTDPQTGAARSAPTADLLSVRFVDRARGGAEGAGLGLLAGAGVGLALSALVVASGDTGPLEPAEGAALITSAFGLIGAGVGAVGGLDRGSQAVYRPVPGAD